MRAHAGVGMLLLVTRSTGGSESRDTSAGAWGEPSSEGDDIYLGDFPWGFYYRVISYRVMLSSHGGTAPGAAGVFGLSFANARSEQMEGQVAAVLQLGQGSAGRLASSASLHARAAEPEPGKSLGHPACRRLLLLLSRCETKRRG